MGAERATEGAIEGAEEELTPSSPRALPRRPRRSPTAFERKTGPARNRQAERARWRAARTRVRTRV
jgi:hypothetical protein